MGVGLEQMSKVEMDSYQAGAAPLSPEEEAFIRKEKWALGTVHKSNEAEKYKQQAQDHGYACRPCGVYEPDAFFTNLRKYHGTVLPGMVSRPSFWICIFVFAFSSTCFSVFDDQCGKHMATIALSDIALPQALLIFFLVFYSNQCYGRFRGEYKALKKIEGNIRSLASIARNSFKVCNKDKSNEHHALYKSMELMRLFGAAYYLMFACLYKGEFHEFNLKSAYQAGLLSFQEVEALRPETRGMRWYRVLDWAYQVVSEACEEGACDKKSEKDLGGTILKSRELMNDIVFEFQMPIPLAYYHLITLLTFCVTIMYSYAAGIVAASNWLFGIVFCVSVVGLLGIREIGMQMAEPFGDDDSDLPVDMYVMNVLEFVTHFIEVSGVARPRANQVFANGTHWVGRANRNDASHHKITQILEGGQEFENELAEKEGRQA